jgi:hypothetical protein
MLAAIRKTAPLAALAVAAILAGCVVEPEPVAGPVYYSGPTAVVVAPYHYHYGYYGHYYGPGYYRWRG